MSAYEMGILHWRENLALDAFVKLMRAAETVAANTHRHLGEAGLTSSQFGVLEALHHLGPLHQRQIGRKILKSSGNITTIIDNLERRDLVRRCRQEKDRRFILVELTERGRELIAALFPRHVAGIVAELSTLTKPEQQELSRLCRKLGLAKRGKALGHDHEGPAL
jgi:MarR family transcriptional regulator, 2-MHQ and catechol-resistance regulon repressor